MVEAWRPDPWTAMEDCHPSRDSSTHRSPSHRAVSDRRPRNPWHSAAAHPSPPSWPPLCKLCIFQQLWICRKIKQYRESSHTLRPASPGIVSCVSLSSMNGGPHTTQAPLFSPHTLLPSQDPHPRTPYDMYWSHPLRLLLAATGPGTFSVFNDLGS